MSANLDKTDLAKKAVHHSVQVRLAPKLSAFQWPNGMDGFPVHHFGRRHANAVNMPTEGTPPRALP
jgi:hypothetical protein